MNVMDEREFFRRSFGGVSEDQLWAAVKRALATQDLKEADDGSRAARFGTGVGVWSWGQNLQATVEAEGDGATVVVRGRPKARFLSSNWGESREAKKLEEDFVPDIQRALDEGASS